MYTPGYDMNVAQPMAQWQQQPVMQQPPVMENDDGDNARRPPNAFILYSQAMRSTVRQENPSLSNTECSRLLGKMWKEVPSEVKLQYKQRAAAAQEEFKKEHPDYTYKKARRKRALNELLNKSAQAYAFDPSMGMGMMGAQPYQMMPGMYGQPTMPMAPAMGQPGMPHMPTAQPPTGMPGQIPQMGYSMDPSAMYSYQTGQK